MRKIGKSLATLTLASAGIALAMMGAAGPASAGSLVDIEVGNVIVNSNISPALAANICDVNVVNIEALRKGDKTECKALSTTLTKSYVVGK